MTVANWDRGKIARKLTELRSMLARESGHYGEVRKAIAEAEAQEIEYQNRMVANEKAAELLKAVIEVRREEVQARVESLVTRGLRAVFEDDRIEFRIDIRITATAIQTKPLVSTYFEGKKIEVDIVDGHGGGVADIVSFLLRVVCLVLNKKPLRKLMVLDESFRHVSPGYLRGVSGLVKELSESVGLQFIIVTHKEELLDCADMIYESSLDEERRSVYVLKHNLMDTVFHSRKALESAKAIDNRTMFDHEKVAKAEEGESILADTDDKTARRNRYLMEKNRHGNHIPGVKQMKGVKGNRFHTIKVKKKKKKRKQT